MKFETIKVVHPEIENKRNRKKVAVASALGSALGVAAGVASVYAMAKKSNPLTLLSELSYKEKDVLVLGAGSVVGGLTAGMIADKNKENNKSKLREASQQFFGNMVFPISTLALGNKILDKTNFRLSQIKSNSKPAKVVNAVLSILPRVAVTIGSLVGGMEVGNKVVNSINNKVFREEVKHEVAAEDYFVHADDICLTANMLLKDAKVVSNVTSKILPLTFLISGAKTGMAEKA